MLVSFEISRTIPENDETRRHSENSCTLLWYNPKIKLRYNFASSLVIRLFNLGLARRAPEWVSSGRPSPRLARASGGYADRHQRRLLRRVLLDGKGIKTKMLRRSSTQDRRRPGHGESGKLDRARSRLYRGQILQENMRLKALAEIYAMHSFARLCNFNFCQNLPICLCKMFQISANN